MLDDQAAAHHRHPVGEAADRVQVVGDEQGGEAHALLQLAHHVDDLGADADVEGGRGLVEDDEVGPGGKGAGDADPLLLAGRQLVRVAEGQARRQVDARQELVDALRAVPCGHARARRSGSPIELATRQRGLSAT